MLNIRACSRASRPWSEYHNMPADHSPSTNARAQDKRGPNQTGQAFRGNSLGKNDMNIRLATALCLMAVPALTIAASAQSSSREQVMLRLPRCATIPDPRAYLDCYYAAVQPMRTELGLAAAPQDATYGPLFTSASPAPGGTMTPQVAATREDVMLRLTRCAAIGDTRQYMDCYYAAAQPLRTELGLAPAPQAATYAPLFALTQAMPAQQRYAGAVPGAGDARANLVPQGAYQQAFLPATRPRVVGEGPTSLPVLGGLLGISSRRVSEAQYGFPNAPTAPNGVDHIAFPMTRVDIDKDTGSFTVTLSNGQIWRQVPYDDNRARWRSDVVGTVVTISYGAGGTYNFTIGDGVLYKVRRVK
jgi:hypothetical protein